MSKSDLGKLEGSPWHVGYVKMKEHDSRRDKRRCLYFHHEENYCSRYGERCRGSSHCKEYYVPSEQDKDRKEKESKARMTAYWENKRAQDRKITIAKECIHYDLASSSCPHHGNCIGRLFCNKYSASVVIGVEPPTSGKKKHKKQGESVTPRKHSSPIRNNNPQNYHSVKPGRKVISKTKAIGVILAVNQMTISVQFEDRKSEAHFPYPDCFIRGHLKLL